MDVDKLPVLGKVKRALNSMMLNFMLLALICITLGLVIPFFPQVLDVLAAAFLIVSGIIFLNMAYNIHKHKKKYFDWIEDLK
ncbi:hypothetical protein GF354_06265 [Candidatus Peregrinibacteria bacterium]|nr:hypothetical protein [Candidatus Peregrinibacteria bacterium]